ncbi:MAG: DUF2871 domain-containing protein [Spirochaetales bacterium]|nr:DUF2871 domain-containing protein [Spirochaetales bacterium]MDD6839789.1 DUF2871 domain-containing protein [Spirochaetales bacterium]
MKKYLNYSLSYGVMGLVCGVYFREFTKIMGFTGITTLSKAHPHFLILGTMLFLIVALFSDRLDLEKDKTFALFMRIYNIGLPLTVLMMLIRGTLQVLGTPLSKGLNASISGIAGIGHILLGVGFILLIVSLKKAKTK